jgi:poly(ADP-ribose) glycohydrolase
MTAVLPHDKEAMYNYIKQLFSISAKNLNEINSIFYEGKCYFFKLIEKYFPKEGQEFMNIYKYLQNLALNIKEIFPMTKIPYLKTLQKKAIIKLTRKQVALIFLLSFFNLIEDSTKNKNGFNVYNILFIKSSVGINFGRCFLNYLTVIGKWLEQGKEDILNESILYIRDNIDSYDYLENGNIDLCELEVYEKGSLFEGDSEYCVDFANMYIGGGALTGGNVQEEILFAVEPEATISMFFMEVMDKNDAIGIYNTIRYSKHKGYGSEFKYEKSAITDDLTKIKRHKIIAIDAMNIANCYYIYKIRNQENIMRDIHKAYVGFNLINFETEKNSNKTIATGNWGCGVFGGNHELKFIEQWIAASFAGVKKLNYYSFNDEHMEMAAKYYKEIKNKYKKAYELYFAIVFSENFDDQNIIIKLLSK